MGENKEIFVKSEHLSISLFFFFFRRKLKIKESALFIEFVFMYERVGSFFLGIFVHYKKMVLMPRF